MLAALQAQLLRLLPRQARTRAWIRCAATGRTALAERLIGPGIDCKVALAFTVQYGSASLVRSLLVKGRKLGANPDLRVDGVPLLLVAHRSLTEPAKKREALAQAGARLESAVGARAWTLLNFAAFFGDVDFARFLISRGADPSAPDRSGLSPIEMARIGGHSEIVDLLKAWGAEDVQPRLSDIEPHFIAENALWSQVHESLKGGMRQAGADPERLEIALEPESGIDARFRYFARGLVLESHFRENGSVQIVALEENGFRWREDVLGDLAVRGGVSLRDLRARVQIVFERLLRGGTHRGEASVTKPMGAAYAEACRILGVGAGASANEVLRAYRGLAKKHHPDAGAIDASRMVEINLAYERIRGRVDEK